MSVRRLIVLAPIEPSPTGNGLAMRTDLFRRSAPTDADVLTVVVPVAGHVPARTGAHEVVRVDPDPHLARSGIAELVADGVWRERLGHAGRLPSLARAASPGLADTVVHACAAGPPSALHVMRSYLAPLGVAVAERLGCRWLTLDLDEDDAAFAETVGDRQDAAAYERLLATFGPLFGGLSAASGAEARALSRRHGFAVEHLPNAVEVPERYVAHGHGQHLLLFVGNLTYGPNAEAARILAEDILPRAKRRSGERIRVRLVGRHHPDLRRLASDAVELTGFVPDVRPHYAEAHAVVLPLKTGAGTRIKLLEAFALGVPAVASPTAAAGLEVEDGRHLLLAADADDAAAALERIFDGPALAASLVREARTLVRDRYCVDVVVPEIREFFARAAARAGERAQFAAPPSQRTNLRSTRSPSAASVSSRRGSVSP